MELSLRNPDRASEALPLFHSVQHESTLGSWPSRISVSASLAVASGRFELRPFAQHAHNPNPDPLPTVDISTPLVTLDTPVSNQQLSGTFRMAGWAFDETAVARVDVYIDRTLVGTATYGIPRPDVAQDWPNAPANVGFTFSLNTALFSNGNHTVQIRATDTNGNVAVLPDVPVTIQN